jgi:hypothetical protein
MYIKNPNDCLQTGGFQSPVVQRTDLAYLIAVLHPLGRDGRKIKLRRPRRLTQALGHRMFLHQPPQSALAESISGIGRVEASHRNPVLRVPAAKDEYCDKPSSCTYRFRNGSD